jgi:hypothetical protein
VNRPLIKKKVANRNAQSARQAEQVKSGTVPDPPLDSAHVTSPNVRDIREPLLGKTLPLAQFTDAAPELLQGWVFGRLASFSRHAADAEL